LFGGVVLLAAASTGIMFYRTRDNSSKRGIGQVIIGTLALAGVLVTFSCALGASIGLFFYASCLLGY
jgi:ABC-type phosphate transport system permease subunit